MGLPLPGEAGSRKREAALAGGAVLLVAALVYFWRKRQPTAAGTSSVAGDTGSAGYTYPMPGGGISTAPGDSTDYNSLFAQNEEILRLLAPSAAGTVGTTTGTTPDSSKPAPSPTQAPDVPTTPWYARDPGPVYSGTTQVGSYTPPAGMPIYTAQDQAVNQLLAAHSTPSQFSSGYLVGGQMVQVDNNYAEAHASDLALASDPYLNPDLRQAAIQRLQPVAA